WRMYISACVSFESIVVCVPIGLDNIIFINICRQRFDILLRYPRKAKSFSSTRTSPNWNRLSTSTLPCHPNSQILNKVVAIIRETFRYRPGNSCLCFLANAIGYVTASDQSVSGEEVDNDR